ncbi:hypothetical protein Y032_0084g1785 [Ancylostoma ceylanicum]|uniref:Uncharacterized protein n=1 Tax=Ancylostoma ceylanicum TaxID=53326 RepID=A0A016TQ34_9BILA|nr:hypothetical protein Y032_0084g1785 [Ancylostoma ceylanicum]
MSHVATRDERNSDFRLPKLSIFRPLTNLRQCAQPVGTHDATRGNVCSTGGAQMSAEIAACVPRGAPCQQCKVANVLKSMIEIQKQLAKEMSV